MRQYTSDRPGEIHEGYRLDIQGMRAISVLLVVVYHLDIGIFSSGFFGVDIFFVISGFVITRLLLRELDHKGRIDLPLFYARRIRRLLPAASLVLFSVLCAAVYYYSTNATRMLSEDVLAAAIYLSNFHFANIRTDYFTSSLSPSPVVHFWSLSIEEQFYLLWPVLLIALSFLFRSLGKTRVVFIFLIGLWVISFGYCVSLSQMSQPLAFFYSGTRWWEIATGGLLALYRPNSLPVSHMTRELLALIGLALILFASSVPSDLFSHPGFATLVPVAGVAFLIFCGSESTESRNTVASRILSTRYFVSLGDRSYSLYLWHWPVLIFTQTAIENAQVSIFLGLVMTLVLVELSYRWVETPFRNGRISALRPGAHLTYGVLMVLLVVMFSVVAPELALKTGLPEQEIWVKRVEKAMLDDGGPPYRDKCHRGIEVDQPECAYATINSRKTIVLFGDSHAAQWFPAFYKVSVDSGWKLHNWTKSSCPSALVAIWDPYRQVRYESCSEWREALFAKMQNADDSYLVVLANLNRYDGWLLGADGESILQGRKGQEAFQSGLRKTVEALVSAGHKVLVIRDTPQARPDYADCIAVFGNSDRCSVAEAIAVNSNNLEERVASEFHRAYYLDMNDVICSGGICPATSSGSVIYRDNMHLTTEYVESLSPILQRKLREMGLIDVD